MKRRNLLVMILGLVLGLVAILVIAQNLQSAGVSVNAPTVGTNISGSFLFSVNITNANGSIPSAINDITNVTITLYSLRNGSAMYNTTINNATCGLPNCANSTRFNVTIDTTAIADDVYNITFTLYNITGDATVDNGKVFLNWTFYQAAGFSGNFTIDNTRPRNVTIFAPVSGAARTFTSAKDAGQIQEFNSTVRAGFTFDSPGDLGYNGHGANGTLIRRVYFNFTNGTNNFAVNASNQSGWWGVRVNISLLTEENPSVVTVWAEDSAGNINRTATINLNVNRLENQNLQNAGVRVNEPTVGTNVSSSFLFSVNITKAGGGLPPAISGITNVTITLHSLGNGSVMYNTTINNATCGLPNCANSTRFNVTINTALIPDNVYNVTFTLYNITDDATADTSKVFLNWTFYIDGGFSGNFTIDTVRPRNVTIFSPGVNAIATANAAKFRSAKDAGQIQEFNATVRAGFTSDTPGDLGYNGHGTNGTLIRRVYFNFTNGTNNFAVNATNQSGWWGVQVNISRITDANPSVVTVWAEDSAGNVNLTATVSLNIDRVAPTVTLSKDDANSDQNKIEVDISTSSDAQACTSDLGTVVGSGTTQTVTATGLTAETEYTFRVECKDELGNAGSASLTATTDAPSGGSAGGDGGTGGGGGTTTSRQPATTPAVAVPGAATVVMDFAVNRATPVTVGSASHTVTVLSATSGTVTVRIASDPVTVTLNTGESKEVDTDGDGRNDLRVRYVALVSGKPKLEFTSLAAPVAAEPEETPRAEETAREVAAPEAEVPATDESTGGIAWVVIVIIIVAAVAAYFVLMKKKN